MQYHTTSCVLTMTLETCQDQRNVVLFLKHHTLIVTELSTPFSLRFLLLIRSLWPLLY